MPVKMCGKCFCVFDDKKSKECPHWMCAEDPDESLVPPGYEIIPSSEIVSDGDVVLDYRFSNGFSFIRKDSQDYYHLIGMTGRKARLDDNVYEVFRAKSLPNNPKNPAHFLK